MNSHYFNQTGSTTNTLHPHFNNFNVPTNYSPLLHPYIPNPQEFMMLRANAIRIMQYKALYAQSRDTAFETDLKIKTESPYEKIESDSKTESTQDQISPVLKEESMGPVLNHGQIAIKEEVQKIVRFFLANMDKNKQAVIDKARSYYLEHPKLLQVFDKLSMKYFSAKKCKEDIIRYVIRKAFRSFRISIMKEEKVSSKKATLILCKRYFAKQTAHLQEGDNIENEEEFLESLMPFNKNSKNKTMNINFILEIFASASFCQEYEKFLPELNQIVVEENKQKEEKLVNFLLSCIEKDNFSKLASFNRMPWTDVWIEDAKNIAIAVMPGKRLVYNAKKSKV